MIKTLKENINILIKPADKGGVTVIMNKEDYIIEGLWQLNNMNHYRRLGLDLTNEFNEQIWKTIEITYLTYIVTLYKAEILHIKSPRISNFYMLPKIHKENNPARPIINSMGSITEKISSYEDETLKLFIKIGTILC